VAARGCGAGPAREVKKRKEEQEEEQMVEEEEPPARVGRVLSCPQSVGRG
jgi:hypothetical protein